MVEDRDIFLAFSSDVVFLWLMMMITMMRERTIRALRIPIVMMVLMFMAMPSSQLRERPFSAFIVIASGLNMQVKLTMLHVPSDKHEEYRMVVFSEKK